MNHVDTLAAPSASADRATPEETEKVIADVEAYCEEIRPIEEICYLEHEPNPAIRDLAKKHDLKKQSIHLEMNFRVS